MSQLVGVLGHSGSGKSRAIGTLDPETTFLFNVIGKPLPVKGFYGKYEMKTGGNMFIPKATEQNKGKNMASDIVEVMRKISQERPNVKRIVIDDFQYLMAVEFMHRALEGGWDRFTEIAHHAWQVLDVGKELRDDLIVYVASHIEDLPPEDEFAPPRHKFKTVGKMLDEKFDPAGAFPIILLSGQDYKANDASTRHYFQTNGYGIMKSPEDMFDAERIPNDLSVVDKAIREFYGLPA